MKRISALLLVGWLLALATGGVEYLHNQQHAREDAAERVAAEAAGALPTESPSHHHDESNCDFHRQLHLPMVSLASVPLLILLGLLVAFLTLLAPVPVSCRIPRRLGCRGPPAC